jgi:putative ABC transport system permease protein
MFQNRLDYQYSFAGMAIWLVIILAISILASAIPARKATQINIRQSLSYE